MQLKQVAIWFGQDLFLFGWNKFDVIVNSNINYYVTASATLNITLRGYNATCCNAFHVDSMCPIKENSSC